MGPLESALAVVNGTDLASAQVRGLMRGYHSRWEQFQSQFDVLSVEEMICGKLWNPATSRMSRSFRTAGVIDVRASRAGRNVIIDHKTTSADITDPDSAYWRQLIVESQPSHYMLLEWQSGRKIDEAIWDVVRKPGIRPSKLTAAEMKAAVMSRKYYGVDLSDSDVVALQAGGRESLGMYEARLAHDCSEERPQWYFQRRSIVRIDGELHEYAGELWDHGQEILHVRSTDRHSRNSGACMNYGRPCQFLGICSGHDEQDSDRWKRKQNVHEELPALDGDGKDVITNSRIRCFQTCRRKHYYEYELGIERSDADEAEALYLGTMWHLAQAAWWGSFIQEVASGNDNTTGSQVSEVCTAGIAG
jgi:hypothetical protein